MFAESPSPLGHLNRSCNYTFLSAVAPPSTLLLAPLPLEALSAKGLDVYRKKVGSALVRLFSAVHVGAARL